MSDSKKPVNSKAKKAITTSSGGGAAPATITSTKSTVKSTGAASTSSRSQTPSESRNMIRDRAIDYLRNGDKRNAILGLMSDLNGASWFNSHSSKNTFVTYLTQYASAGADLSDVNEEWVTKFMNGFNLNPLAAVAKPVTAASASATTIARADNKMNDDDDKDHQDHEKRIDAFAKALPKPVGIPTQGLDGTAAPPKNAKMDEEKDVKSDGKADGKAEDKKKAVSVFALDDPIMDRIIDLEWKDKSKTKIRVRDARISNLIMEALEHDTNADTVPLPSVDSKIGALIVKYMVEHKGIEAPIIEKPLRSKNMKDVTNKFDAEYITTLGPNAVLYELILAANYMAINGLLHLGLAFGASQIKGEPLAKVKEALSKERDPAKQPLSKAAAPAAAADTKEKSAGSGGAAASTGTAAAGTSAMGDATTAASSMVDTKVDTKVDSRPSSSSSSSSSSKKPKTEATSVPVASASKGVTKKSSGASKK